MLPSKTINRAHIVLWALWDIAVSFLEEPADLLAQLPLRNAVPTLPAHRKVVTSATIPLTAEVEKLVYN